MNIPGLQLDVNADGIDWRATASPGVSWYLLASEPTGEARGAATGATVMIRMEPGCGYPPHKHLDVEEVLVLAGGYRDEFGTYEAGDYVRYEKGSVHAPIALGEPNAGHPACILYASARGGISPVETS
jgi:anti-sigma factor ChrR (cupin superfamily)